MVNTKVKDQWGKLADNSQIEKTVRALKQNNIEAFVVDNGNEAKNKVLEILPKGVEVMTMSSETLKTTRITEAIDKSGVYSSVRNKLLRMNRNTQGSLMQKLGAAPDWVIGSVQAVTEDGKIIAASNTGSQFSAYAYGSPHVIWVVGTQKIVKDLDAGMRRIYDYVLDLESARLKKIYPQIQGSNVSKLLIINKEVQTGRITVIFVKKLLGF